MTRCLAFCTLLVTATTFAAVDAQRLRPRDVDALPSKPPDTRIPYGTDDRQYGELRLPKGSGPFPVAVVIHGGCWVEKSATLQNTAALADALRDAGIATWNIEYRRADSPGGGWPRTFADIADGVDILRRVAEEHALDLKRVITVGHSAGAHLALWAAARQRLPSVEIVEVPGGHFEVIAPTSAAWPTVRDSILLLLRE